MKSRLDLLLWHGYSGTVNPRELAEGLMNGRIRIIDVRVDRGYDDAFLGDNYGDPFAQRYARAMIADIRVEVLDYYESGGISRIDPKVLADLMDPKKIEPYVPPKPDPKLCLEKLILLTKIAILAWADSLDDSVKRVAMLEPK